MVALELIQGLALLLALCLLQTYILRIWRGHAALGQLCSGVLFGGICLAGMLAPLTLSPGLAVDARSVVLSMAGLIGGPLVALVSGLMVCAYQAYQGDAGTVLALIVTAECMAAGLVYRWMRLKGWAGTGAWSLLGFGLLLHLAVALSVYPGLASGVAAHALSLHLLPLVLVYAVVTMLLGLVLQDVARRHATERALQAQEARLRAVGNAIPDMLLVLDEDGQYLEILSSARSMLLADAAELIGQRVHQVLPQALADTFVAQVRSTLESGKTHAFEYDLDTLTGPRRFEARTHPLAVPAGARRAVVFLTRDISERSAAQASLRVSETRFRSVLHSIPSVAVQGYAQDGTTVYWNAASERLYGYTAQEALGRHRTELIIPAAAQEQVRAAMARRVAGREDMEAEETVRRHKDGSEVAVFSSYARVEQADGSVELFCFDIDLAERRRAEAELRIAAIAFEAQEGMLVTGADRKILRVNQAFTRITGYEAYEVFGTIPHMFSSSWHDADFYAAMEQALQRDGKWEGEIWSRRKSGDVFPEWLNVTAVADHLGRTCNYVATFTDITQRKAAEDQIRQLAFYDPLTGLPNRRMLMDRLQHALAASERTGAHGALLFIDLDHFKTLNDTLGHDKGDILLQQVAQRLVGAVRGDDTVARLGGDEYVVMLEGLGTQGEGAAAQATAVGEKLITVLNQPYNLAGNEYHSTPSVGIALYSGRNSGIDDLLKQADLAMYQAKGAGRNRMRFFDPQMQAVVSQRVALETDIRRGVLLGQFLLHYQPQVNALGQVMGAEALLRWGHPMRGMVSPADFIPVAEDSGQILALGSWVLETACAQLVTWAADPRMEHLTLAVNVSSRQFRQQDFADYVLGMLDYTGANPRRLKLELTESLLADNLDDVIVKMDALRERGVGFSLDDFGTGYSSLSYLKRLPLDQLKIDQSFVRDVLTDPNDAVIAKTIVALGNSLGLSVIAEGVETNAQRDFLQGVGCDTYQGYLFSRPVPAEAFVQYVRTA